MAAAKGDDDPPPARRQAPYMVASTILDERADADTLTPAQLVEAMAERGHHQPVDRPGAPARAALTLSTRIANRRPTREPRPTGAANGGRTAARPK